MLYYWRRDGSLACSADVPYAVSKVFVDPGNHAYVVTVGEAGKARNLWPLKHQATTAATLTVLSQTLLKRHRDQRWGCTLTPHSYVQITFWRRAGDGFNAVPVATLHAGKRGDFADIGMRVTDACGLTSGLTLVATNRCSLLVVEKLKVAQRLEGLPRPARRLAALPAGAFALADDRETVDVYDVERSGESLPGARAITHCSHRRQPRHCRAGHGASLPRRGRLQSP